MLQYLNLREVAFYQRELSTHKFVEDARHFSAGEERNVAMDEADIAISLHCSITAV